MHESYGAEFKGGILKKGSEEPRLEKGMSYSTGGCKHWHLRTQSPAASAAGTRRAEREMGFRRCSKLVVRSIVDCSASARRTYVTRTKRDSRALSSEVFSL